MNLHDFDRPAPMPGSQPPAPPSAQQLRYWQRTRRLTGLLLLIWLGVVFGLSYFARELSFDFFGWPFSFWVAAQGALLVFCLIVAVYAWAMHRLDQLHAGPG